LRLNDSCTATVQKMAATHKSAGKSPAAMSDDSSRTIRKRSAVATPESDVQSAKRRKREDETLEESIQLAFAHLIHDDPSHQLYDRNADLIIRNMVDEEKLDEAISAQFNSLFLQARSNTRPADRAKLNRVKEVLGKGLAKLVLQRITKHLVPVLDIEVQPRNFSISDRGELHQMEYTIRPVEKETQEVVSQSIGAKDSQSTESQPSQPKQTFSSLDAPGLQPQANGVSDSEDEDSESSSSEDDDDDEELQRKLDARRL
jgi:hypothetical protein